MSQVFSLEFGKQGTQCGLTSYQPDQSCKHPQNKRQRHAGNMQVLSLENIIDVDA
jgi:hypothetical protein